MHGYTGKILRVNLSSATISKEELPSHLIEYIGGTGFAARILFDEVEKGIDPLTLQRNIVE